MKNRILRQVHRLFEADSVIRSKALAPVLMVTLVLISCSVIPKLNPVRTGVVATPGVEIIGVDENFRLTSGGTWEPPFQSSANLSRQFKLQEAQLTEQYDYALDKLNAQRVRVKTPYLDKELYGVLALNQAMENKGPVTRSYQISIPEQYVQQALNGKISVLYEYYHFGDMGMDRNVPTWILWLSDVPF